MRHENRTAKLLSMLAVAGALSCGCMAIAASVPSEAPSETVTGTWQHRQVTFNYFGVTTLFTCDGLEEHVRSLLLLLGARKDAHVTASGCSGPNTPSHSAFVHADFYALAPAEATAADTVQANWAPLQLTPRHPSDVTDGDCELLEQMKDFITQNFSLRNVDYRTSCFPHEITLDGFAIKGQSLRAAVLPPAVKG
jgi:hypothetical protein